MTLAVGKDLYKMDPLKISVLYWEDRTQSAPEHDEVVDEVAAALGEAGHKVALLGIYNDLRELLDKLDEQKPQLVFNLAERFADNDLFDMHVITVLDILGLPFTGAGPLGAALRQDKTVTKKLLKFHDVPYPNSITFDKNEIEFAGNIRFPLFVKPVSGDASNGIDDSSLVTEYSKLVERISFIQTQLKLPALVEEYIEGREFYVSILGNSPAEVLPVMELDFAKLPDGFPRIYGSDAKSDVSSVQYNSVNAIVATELSPEVRARIAIVGREAAYALKVRDYARVDIRLTDDGRPIVLEVNANPYLERTSAFALAALQAGMGYNTLINRIVDIAWKRYESNPVLTELQKSRAGKPRIRRKPVKPVEPGGANADTGGHSSSAAALEAARKEEPKVKVVEKKT
jgi:D-alanine-D-alanine ligase